MVRIEKLPTGTLVVHGEEATYYVDEIDHSTSLTDKQKSDYKMLQAVDVGVELEGLGWRYSENTTWLYDREGEAMNFMLAYYDPRTMAATLESYIKVSLNLTLKDAVNHYLYKMTP